MLKRLKLWKLKMKAFMLEAEADHRAELMATYHEEYIDRIARLKRVRREILLREAPEVVLRNAVNG